MENNYIAISGGFDPLHIGHVRYILDGDRTYKNTPEIALCEKLEIPIILGLGGGKIQSSSELIKNVRIH